MSGLVEWAIFLALSVIAILTAGGMLITMSMYRAGLALMSSFLALAGLFVLLDADLLAAIQVMMNVGGMLVMVLFMVMLMMDPGGEMMWDMKRKMHLPGPGAFSMAMPRQAPPDTAQQPEAMDHPPAQEQSHDDTSGDWTCPMHPEVSATGPGACPKCGMPLVPRAETDESSMASGGAGGMHAEHADQAAADTQHTRGTEHSGGDRSSAAAPQTVHAMAMGESTEGSQGGMAMEHASGDAATTGSGDSDGAMAGMGRIDAGQHHQMMVDMAMSTTQLPWALALGTVTAVVLIVLVVRTAWPLATAGPTQDATVAVGELLLSRYMIAFEGAAFLILAGIAGAVIFATRDGEPPAAPKAAATTIAERPVYTCPMHPQVRQDQPGACPICGMDLVLAEDERTSPANAVSATVYTCPMHPEVRQNGPGTCPKCGMDLVPADEPPGHIGAGHGHGGTNP